jgi:hypothetical protein
MIKTTTKWVALVSVGVGALLLAGCVTSKCCKMKCSSSSVPFGTADGKPVTLYTLKNAQGSEAKIMNYGGIVQSLKVADKNGKFDDIVLGYDDVDGYVKVTPYFGCLVCRYGNRIGGAKFTLDGQTYTLATNNGPNSLHGGVKGFDKSCGTWSRPRGIPSNCNI